MTNTTTHTKTSSQPSLPRNRHCERSEAISLKEAKSLTPKLRFKEFEGEWEERKLGDISAFSKGKSISKSDIDENGILECIRYGELYTVYDEVIFDIKSKTNLNADDLVLSESNDVIIPASGETQIDIATASCVLKDGIALGGDLNIIKSKTNGVFLSYYLNSKKKIDIARLSQGISVVHLYSSQLKTLNLNLPQDEEQQKIANFLTAVDTKLQQLTTKKETLALYKKGVMQQLFSQQLRFKPDVTNETVIASTQDEAISPNETQFPDWEEKRLGEVFKIFNGYAFSSKDSTDKGVLWVKIADVGIQEMKNDSISFLPDSFLEEHKKFILEKGDYILALTRPILNGKLKIARVNEFFNNSLLNQRVGKIVTENNKDFVYFLLQQDFLIKSIENNIAGSDPPNLSPSEINNLKVMIPKLKEQQKIATYLSAIDKKIEAVQAQITQTQAFKKGLLQQMFV